MVGEISFLEFGGEDAGRGKAFYSGLFGWEFVPGPSGEGYSINGSGVPAGMHGGDKGASPYIFFKVDDLNAAIEKVRSLGGVVEDMDVDGDDSSVAKYGRFKLCRDDQGSPFGLHEPPLS